MRILVSGSHGLVGRRLCADLARDGHDVVRLVRGEAAPDEVLWDPPHAGPDADRLADIDAVVHLAGDPIAKPWTAAAKRSLRASRVDATGLLVEALNASPRERVLVSASAVGYYGSRPGETLDETSTPGTGFLADLCRGWEEAAAGARAGGARVVSTRFGIILDRDGGMLKGIRLGAKAGPVARMGAAERGLPWVAIDDVVGAIRHALVADLSGPVNVVTPTATSNGEFSRVLGGVLHRPVLPVPGRLLRLALGEMADEMLLQDVQVRPSALLESGYQFRAPRLEPALRALLG